MSSDAPIFFAFSTKRAWRSASVSFGFELFISDLLMSDKLLNARFASFGRVKDGQAMEAVELLLGERQPPPGKDMSEARSEAWSVLLEAMDRAELPGRQSGQNPQTRSLETPNIAH